MCKQLTTVVAYSHDDLLPLKHTAMIRFVIYPQTPTETTSEQNIMNVPEWKAALLRNNRDET